ncbi:MAG: hypothetical protein E4H01_13755 [Lysobacterales bacterium]|nr:MAG: hypothetical protein E4H01_13755 [Xanthomonadales bacterium]
MRYLLIFAALLSSGCTLFQKPKVVVQHDSVYLAVLCPDPAKPAQITTRRIRPQVVEDKVGIFWVGLTPQDYENLAINTQETIRYIKDQHGVIAYYRKCIVQFNEKIEEKKAAE